MKFFWFLIFFVFGLNIAQAGIVKPVFKQLKDPKPSGSTVPSTVSIQITPDGKKMFLADHLENSNRGKIYIYNLTTPFDISTLDVDNRTIVTTHDKGDAITVNFSNIDIEFNNDGTKIFLFTEYGQMLAHNLPSPYDVASISASTLVPDDGLDYNTAYGTVSSVKGVEFNNDGTKMYLNDGQVNSNDVTQVNLSTPFDPSSGTFAFNLNTQTNVGTGRYTMDISFDDDGTRLYISEARHRYDTPSGLAGTATFMYVYKLSTPFELSSATYVDKYQISGNGNNVSAYGWTFGNNGMKAYIATEDQNDDGDDIIYEYDLTCPYGIVICEEDTVSNTSAQVDVAKQAIHQNSSVIFKRFDWLRRNEGNNNLNSNNINLNINNPILSALSDTLKNTFNQKYTKASVKNKKETRSNFKNLSFWSHGDISIGRTGDKATTTPQTLKVGGLMFGVDKKLKNNKFVGAAIRYGQGNTYNKTSDGFKLDSETLTLNLYSTNQLDSKLNLNTLLGLSVIKIDQLNSSDQVTGNRNGKQLFTAINMNSDGGYGEFNIRPTGGFMFGITSLSSYTDFNTSSVQDIYDSLVFNTGNITAGLKFDKLVEKTNFNLFRNGSIEYIQDLSSNIGYTVKSHSDLTSQRKSVKRHSLHNLKVNFGMESVSESGHTFGLNFERLQGLDESSHLQSLFFKFGYLRENNTDIAFNFDPLTSNTANLSYLKHYNYFDLKLDTNYSFMDENPGYGLNLQLSNTF